MPTRHITERIARILRVFTTKLALTRLTFTGLLPLAIAFAAMRYLVVPPGLCRDSVSRFFGQIGHRYPVFLAALCAVTFMSIASHFWREREQHFTRDDRPTPARLEPKREPRWRELVAIALTVAVATAAALTIRSQLAETHQILSSSMLPSLAIGDQVAVNKAAYRSEWASLWGHTGSRSQPRHGELIVFEQAKLTGISGRLIKRVIGVPGDRIRMQGAAPIINDWMVPRCDVGTYANLSESRNVIGRLVVEFLGEGWHLALYAATPPLAFEEYVVRDGELFVLGDNRGDSIDSRTWVQPQAGIVATPKTSPGGVPFASIKGRADWFLVGTNRDGAADFGRILQSPSRQLRIEGVDIKSLEDGIRNCISKQPNSTYPPKPAERIAVIARQ